MKFDDKLDVPIYVQVANNVEDYIFKGIFKEESQVMSTTEIASFYKINPATVLKGMNILVEKGILFKKRGLGLFVCKDAKSKIMEQKQLRFEEDFIIPLLKEARRLNIEKKALIERMYEIDETTIE